MTAAERQPRHKRKRSPINRESAAEKQARADRPLRMAAVMMATAEQLYFEAAKREDG